MLVLRVHLYPLPYSRRGAAAGVVEGRGPGEVDPWMALKQQTPPAQPRRPHDPSSLLVEARLQAPQGKPAVAVRSRRQQHWHQANYASDRPAGGPDQALARQAENAPIIRLLVMPSF